MKDIRNITFILQIQKHIDYEKNVVYNIKNKIKERKNSNEEIKKQQTKGYNFDCVSCDNCGFDYPCYCKHISRVWR